MNYGPPESPQGWPPPPPGWPHQQPGGFGRYPHGAPPQPSASTRATVALVLAMVSWVMCGCFTALPALLVAKAELDAIRAGTAPKAGESQVVAALWIAGINAVLWLGVIGIYTVLIAFGLVAMITMP